MFPMMKPLRPLTQSYATSIPAQTFVTWHWTSGDICGIEHLESSGNVYQPVHMTLHCYNNMCLSLVVVNM